MPTVSGVVLVRETQAVIPNLQVVLYDLDSQLDKSALRARQKVKSQSRQSHVASAFWERFTGDRLGSTLTDARGQFTLSFDIKDAAEARADLVLLVMAPEDTASCDGGVPVPRPSAERLLHFSHEPIVNSGQQESYVIRLPRERLDALSIPYPAVGSSRPADAAAVVVDLRKATADHVHIEEARKEQLRARAKPAVDVKRRTESMFRTFSLSSVPPEVRALPTYLNQGDDLNENQRQVIAQAIEGIPRLVAEKQVDQRLRIRLPQADVRALGLASGPDGEVEGTVSAHRLLRYLARTSGGSELTAARSLAERCKAEYEAERRFRETLARCGTQSTENAICEPPPPVGGLGFDTTDEFVREHVGRQMRHAAAPETELAYGVERDGVLTATITRPGPADVTAYHDFHELQIAFEFIWKEAFDRTITGRAKNLYAEIVRFANQVSGVPEEVVERINAPVETVDDMRRLYQDVRLLQQIIAREDDDGRSSGVQPSTPTRPLPHEVKQLLPTITEEEDWSGMEASEQRELVRLAADTQEAQGAKDVAIGLAFITAGTSLAAVPGLDSRMQRNRDAAGALLQASRARRASRAEERGKPPAASTARASSRLEELMTALDQRLSERFKFDIFAPNSINYGIMLTYRQAWTPRNYQVGDLVSTVPLAPKEVRRYSKKRVVTKSRTQKELEDSQSTRRSESESTSRADSEIVKRATNKTSFQQTAEGTANVGVFQGRFGTQFGIDAEKASSSTKKNFREAVSKAAEEYKQQHRLEVETVTSETVEATDSGEISNPNDEITVTYLFYELQRQYDVSERIHRLTPVILVANEVPDPDISLDWIIANHWILRRVILDDQYLPALDYVVTSAVGDEMALEVMWTNLQRQAKLVDDAAEQLRRKTQLAEEAFNELRRLTQLVQEPEEIEKFRDVNLAAAFGPFALIGLLGGGDNDAAEKREEVAKLAIERADKDEQETSASLAREVVALQKIIETYTTALREHLDRQTAIAALRIHLKENILCYMHAIWDYECGPSKRVHASMVRAYRLVYAGTGGLMYRVRRMTRILRRCQSRAVLHRTVRDGELLRDRAKNPRKTADWYFSGFEGAI